MAIELVLKQLKVRGVRNLTRIELDLAPRINVISGNNGHGKTSVLEALYFLATSRSFRTDRLSELVQDSTDGPTRVDGVFTEAGITRNQRAVISGTRRSLFIDDKRQERLSAYATRTPVVVFHPGELDLVTGGAARRRTLLDRIALFIDATSADDRLRYARAQKERQLLLERRGGDEVAIFEQLMAQHGVQLVRARARAAQALSTALLPVFARMAASDLELELRYATRGTDDPHIFLAELQQRRERDRRSKTTTFGPHRDDVEIVLNGRMARRHASQGQQRLLALSLKIAELECVRQARGAHPLLLLDDVSSELDPSRTGAVYDFVRESESQVLATTTRPELFTTPGLDKGDRADFEVVDGALKS